ncbi:MAG TPA: carboxypeptidase-like regulatory domain-containing protein [Candidatus Acidoferrales bacterium]|nr:carboxypeptidase-like regulatory domain-containing protein [Candidatus Acidoferrales bacterium]
MNSRLIRKLIPLLGLIAVVISPLAADSRMGRISGLVLDESGVPQMGATVVIASHSLAASVPLRLFTNGRGRFISSTLPTGAYTVRVTLAGFLPTLRPDVQVSGHQTTSLQIQMGSIFTGLAELRRNPNQRTSDDDWGWVLRAAAATRPILRWQGTNSPSASASDPFAEAALAGDKWHSRLDVSSGVRPGSATSFSDSPATAVAYQEGVGAGGQLLLAGQFSYESDSPNGGFAAIWLPTGDTKNGPVSSAVVRESRLGPNGPIFRGARFDQQGVIALDDNVTIRYGAEYLLTSLNNAVTEGVRPRAEVAVQLAPNWQASLLVASRPWPSQSPEAVSPLESAVDSLDAFPTMLFHNGKPVLESGWHEELAVERLLRNNGRLMVAAFHDRSSDMAVYGRGTPANNSEFLQDFFSDGFAYDSGNADSFGVRAAYQQKFSDDLSATLVYAWAGALAPLTQVASDADLRDILAVRQLHSVAGSVSSKLPILKTQVTAGYKWLSGMAVSRQDEFGEVYFGLDPYFNLVVRQPIPCMHHMQAVADFGNLLAQGYIPLTTRDGRVVLVSAYRTFRGGVSVQF